MGCSVVYRGTVTDLYINQPSPPCELLMDSNKSIPDLFPPSGVILKGDTLYFDDKELIKQAQLVHIYSIIIFAEEFVNGFEVEYHIDSNLLKSKRSKGQTGKEFSLILGRADFITKMTVTYDKYVHSIEFETRTHQKLVAKGTKGEGPKVRSLDFTKENRGIVGFKGEINENLSALYAYSWRLRDKIH